MVLNSWELLLIEALHTQVETVNQKGNTQSAWHGSAADCALTAMNEHVAQL